MKNPITAVTTAVGELVAPLRDALSRVRTAEEAKRREVEAADAALSRLESQRAPDTEALAALDPNLEQRATAWREAHGAALVDALAGRFEKLPGRPVTRVVFPVSLDDALGALTWDALIALVPEIRAGLTRAIVSVPDGDGSPLRTRLREIAEQAERKAARVREHAEIVDEAATHRVGLEHLDETREGRLADKATQEAADRVARDLARRVRN